MHTKMGAYTKGVEAIIVSIIYDRKMPILKAGLFTNPGALLWWLGGDVEEPTGGGYERVDLETEPSFWLRQGPAVSYVPVVFFKCETESPYGWGPVLGWSIIDREGTILLCEKFKKGPFKVRKGDEVELKIKFRL